MDIQRISEGSTPENKLVVASESKNPFNNYLEVGAKLEALLCSFQVRLRINKLKAGMIARTIQIEEAQILLPMR